MAWQSLWQIPLSSIKNHRVKFRWNIQIKVICVCLEGSVWYEASMFSISLIHSICFRPQNCEIWFSHRKSLLLPLLTQSSPSRLQWCSAQWFSMWIIIWIGLRWKGNLFREIFLWLNMKLFHSEAFRVTVTTKRLFRIAISPW